MSHCLACFPAKIPDPAHFADFTPARFSATIFQNLTSQTKCQTPLHEHRLWTCCTTPPMDELTTMLQLVVQQIYHISVPEPNISTYEDVGMWQMFVRCW